MAKRFIIEYKETYSKTYEIDAETSVEAREILYRDICLGKMNGPEECTESSMEILCQY